MKPRRLFWICFAVLLLADRLSKLWAEGWLQVHDSVTVIPGFFDLTYVRNTGVAFGMFQKNNTVLIGVALAVVGVMIYLGRQLDWRRRDINAIAGIFASGALGNIWDRFQYGYVIDFADFYVGRHHWPAFNVADSCICVAVARMVWESFQKPVTRGS